MNEHSHFVNLQIMQIPYEKKKNENKTKFFLLTFAFRVPVFCNINLHFTYTNDEMSDLHFAFRLNSLYNRKQWEKDEKLDLYSKLFRTIKECSFKFLQFEVWNIYNRNCCEIPSGMLCVQNIIASKFFCWRKECTPYNVWWLT